jgi:hypothetical protein
MRVIGALLFTVVVFTSMSGCEDGALLTDVTQSDVASAADSGDSGAFTDAVSVPDVMVQPETTQADVILSEDVSEPGPCETGFGCFEDPCGGPEDCNSGICTQHLGDKICSKTCDVSCPDGWSCGLVGGSGDGQYVCISNFSHLCLPCDTTEGCSGHSPNACIVYPEGGSFCGGTCDLETPCPAGYTCQEAETTSGMKSFQCVAEAGICECSQLAIDSGASTTCVVSNELGECSGARVCAPDGLQPCNAPVPSEETCNGVDDDCDGMVDEATCDDGNSCSDDTCAGEGGCVNTPIDGGECLDGDPCTAADHCEGGLCVGTPVNCDDENPCTKNACDGAGGCSSEPAAGLCDDGDPCTVGDVCDAGVCVANVTLECDDGNPCTVDSCGPSGCLHVSTAEPCDDGNPCTAASSCVDGACVASETTQCDDQNPCTSDSCDLEAGCVSSPNALPCDDQDVCTQGDTCAEGSCQPGTNIVACDDGNSCTDDACDDVAGCVFLPNFGACDDLNPCTSVSECDDGACLGSEAQSCDDENDCTSDGCDPASGCVHNDNALPCDDQDVCTLGDQCGAGACQSGASELSCADGNPCTSDTCDPTLGCLFVPNDQGCDDLNECTVGDTCVEGACVGAGSLACDDQNPCTLDTCLLDGGCSNTPVDVACDDGDACTVNDTCFDGACASGVVLSCDDGNPCTYEQCDGGDCVFEPNDLPCDDGNACTDSSQCQGGACVATSGAVCSDDNPCTDSGCDPSTGCVVTNNGAACDDGSVCSLGDHCVGGACEAGAGLLSCNDGSPCTQDSCDADVGCVFNQTVFPCCDGGTQACGDVCVDTQVDPNHCGGCEDACLNGETCSGGACVSVCGDGKTLCSGDCEDTESSPENCGSCGFLCPTQANTQAVCETGECSLTCAADFADCNLDMGDGCEVSLASDLTNCGACGEGCTEVTNGTAACVGGSCAVAQCDGGFGNCDVDTATGCETPLSTTADCGACGASCAQSQSCTDGECADSPTSFLVMESKDVTHQGQDYLLLKVSLLSQDSVAANWCAEYQELCGLYGYSPTGCGPSWNNGGYGDCKTLYGSYAPDNSLSCNPSGPISTIASSQGYADATGTNSFGFHYCDAGSCTKTLCEGTHCNSALSYIDYGQPHGYTVCIK